LIRTVIETAVGNTERGEAAVLALVARGRVLGVMVLCRGIRPFEEEDLTTITDLARLMGLAIDNARLYEESQRAIRARDQTIAVVSHDLRNPVNAIRMIASNVLTGVNDAGDPSLVEYVQIIQQAARQADRLIQDLLDVARIEAGRLRIEPVETRLLPLLRDALEVMLPLAGERGVELKADLQLSAEDVVIVDPGRVHQVVSNLVGNAIKFTPRGGTIVLRASIDDGVVRASVQDTGIGIPAESLPHLFDRFWRGREDRRGSGLGLTISKGIVEAHGGRIWVESQVGQGTTVTFELPAKAPDTAGA
jgi:signal transduction histidine kinase